jgi:hypothetical protein
VTKKSAFSAWQKIGFFVVFSCSFFVALPLIGAEAIIANNADNVANRHTKSGFSTVFIDDDTGYRFYTITNGTCYYAKTTDGGDTWGGATQINNLTDCGSISVWYDRWTPGDSGDYIHVVTMHQNSAREDIRYNRLDTTDDSLLVGLTGVDVTTGQTPTIGHGAAKPALTKGTDGTIYTGLTDNTDGFIVECTSNCNLSGSWSETGSVPMDIVTGDMQLLVPLLGGNILLIDRDRTANDVRSKVWNNTNWTAFWTLVDANAPENATYEPSMSAVVDPDTGDVFLAYVADVNNFSVADHDIRTAIYSGGSWSRTADILTNDSRGLTELAMAVDGNTDDVYVTYGARSSIGIATTTDIYWASSTNAMTSWSTEQGPLNVTSDDFYGLDTNYRSDQRLYVSWHALTTLDMRGETMFDPTPPLTVSALGNQVSELRGSTTNNYIGGTFVFEEFDSSRSVTSITLTETGSVDGANDINNIRLLYEFDTSAPHNCASESFSGSELQYGATDANGFNGANGIATFVDSVLVSTSSALCLYVLFDLTNSAADGQQVEIEISDPSTDIGVTGGVNAQPTFAVALSGSTAVVVPELRQTGFHWRNDDGTEASASSATGGIENTALVDLPRGEVRRLRLAVSNDGSTTTLSSTFRLEYGVANPTCGGISTWIDVNDTDDAWNLFNSTSITNGTDSTDIATSSGGVSNPNSSFATPNGGLLDTTSQTNAIVLDDTEFVEYEFALAASTTAVQGSNYCFRVTYGGAELTQYVQYPQASIAADVNVSTAGSQELEVQIGGLDSYAGGVFIIDEASTARDVTAITLSEGGTIDASTDLSNIRLFYDSDTTAPYNCASESYTGGESQFGVTVAAGFSAPNGTASFSDAVEISPTSTLCVYVVYDVENTAQNGETVELEITNPNLDVSVSGGATVAPSSPIALAGTTNVTGAIVTQTHYHWRLDNGSETTASSATSGTEDTAIVDLDKNEPYRLRLGLANTGGTSSVPVQYTLQYGIRETTCDVVAAWTDVDAFANDSWDMFNSSFLTDEADTTDIPVADGGVSDGATTFLSSNSGIAETDATTPTTTLAADTYVDLEFSLTTTGNTPFETDFCFRVVENGSPLVGYDTYAEATTKVNRDYKIQRGNGFIAGTGQTFTAGVDYDAPASTSVAFVRITNFHHTGAGRNTGPGNQNPDDVTAYIITSDLTSSFTIERDTDSVNNTFVAWELIEYIGAAGTDNEMIVREVDTISFSAGQAVATTSAISPIADDADIVVFVTGARMTNQSRSNTSNARVTAAWSSTTNQAVFTRDANNVSADVSYAVVEFVGDNWKVQRVEHEFVAAGAFEAESIKPVNDVTKAFIETQKRHDFSSIQADYGAQVWLSGMGTVSFLLDSGADMGLTHTAVAWVIENIQNGAGEMRVFDNDGFFTGGTNPATTSINFATPGVNDTSNASIFGNATVDRVTNGFPEIMGGLYLTSTTTFELLRSDTEGNLSFRVSVVEWPAADVSVRQNDYRWYNNTNGLTPGDAWPPGVESVGENAPITVLDTPVGDGDVIRLRTSLRVSNGTLPAGLQSYKLQYGLQESTCSAISTWNDVGAPGSGVIWRGFDNGAVADNAALGTNPPGGGQVLLSESDRAGRYVEGGVATANPYNVLADEDAEYDWVIQHNGATQRSDYCFRIVQTDGTQLAEYLDYPALRTRGYAPVQADWRWYDDENTLTPSVALAAENTAPVELEKGNIVKLRVLIDEVNNLEQTNARFRLQYSETPDFSVVSDVVDSGSCSATDVWCYADGAGVDNAVVDAVVLTNADTCASGVGDGCGTHHESTLSLAGYTHQPLSAAEFEFTLQYQVISGYYGQVWYFRVFDVANDELVPLDTLASYPSIVGESGAITFTVEGLATATATEGVVTTASTTPIAVPFGVLTPDVDVISGQRLTVDTNAVSGFVTELAITQPLQNSQAAVISDISGTNASPVGWGTGCSGLPSCFGYHSGDDTLSGSGGRFSLDDSYAAASTTPGEIMYSAVPGVTSEDIIYRIRVGGTQAPGDYTSEIRYLVTPVF